jgi:dTDP-4-dehydrorhamnose reductase
MNIVNGNLRMSKKVLVTGAGGMLGSAVTSLFKDRWEVVGLKYQTDVARVFFDGMDHPVGIDIASHGSVYESLYRHKPDIVINCAAYTDVEGAEDSPALAYKVNGHGPALLAEECRKFGAKLVHISTDYVFKGNIHGPVSEEVDPQPLSVYGRSKLAGEMAVRDVLPNDHLIIRTSALFGHNGKNFIKTVLDSPKKSLSVVDDQYTVPTHVEDLAYAINGLLMAEETGTYHVTNNIGDHVPSWFDIACLVVQYACLDKEIKPTKTEYTEYKAKRPRISVLDCGKLNKNFPTNWWNMIRTWDNAVKDYIDCELSNKVN